MKKFLLTVLILALSVSLVACGGKDDTTVTTDAPVSTDAPEGGDITPDVGADTVGGKHWAAFVAEKTANPAITAEELAGKLVMMEMNQFMGGAMPVEPGFLSGFDNYEVKDFETGVMFCPMIGSIPYVGYVFDLAEGADVAAFVKGLTDNANPRWNICVTADQTVAGSIGNTVFFLMCPETYEMPTMPEDNGGADVFTDSDIFPEVDETSVGGQHWTAFVDAVLVNPEIGAEELANQLVTLEMNQFSGGTMPVEAGVLSGFDNYEVTGFEKGVMFCPMIGSIPYVGYVFELAEGTDVAAFVKGLEENANPRWNICVTADQTVIGSIGNTVFFLMCPATYDAPADGGMALSE